MFYWLRNPMFGPPAPISYLTDWLSVEPLPLAAMTWGTLVLEFLLGISITLPRRWKQPLLVAGLLLHLGIAVLMGLRSFAFAMWAGLLLTFRPESTFVAVRFPSVLRARAGAAAATDVVGRATPFVQGR